MVYGNLTNYTMKVVVVVSWSLHVLSSLQPKLTCCSSVMTTWTLTVPCSQGSAMPTDPGRNKPADNSCRARLFNTQHIPTWNKSTHPHPPTQTGGTEKRQQQKATWWCKAINTNIYISLRYNVLWKDNTENLQENMWLYFLCMHQRIFIYVVTQTRKSTSLQI